MARNIRDEHAFVSSWWDWSIYNDCFEDTGIRISDIDGMVERNGYYLWIETKKPQERIPMGQQIVFDHLMLLHEFEVLVIYGETDYPQRVLLWRTQKEYEGGVSLVKSILRRWFAHANAKPRIWRKDSDND